MSMAHDNAQDALRALLWELPAEFSQDPATTQSRSSFQVVKSSNVRKVHRALWELQKSLGLDA